MLKASAFGRASESNNSCLHMHSLIGGHGYDHKLCIVILSGQKDKLSLVLQ